MNRLLVFGGSGLLGRHLLEWAGGSAGPEVIATHLTSPPSALGDATWCRCDILDRKAVFRLVDDVRPDVVVNAAYRQSGPDAHEICSIGARSVAEACALVDARLIHISTDLVFDGTLGRPYTETDDPTPLGSYGDAKAEAEALVSDSLDDVAIVRTSLIYGESTAPQERLVERAIADGDIAFFTDEWRSPAEVRRLAAAVGSLASTSYTGLIHLAGDERIDRLGFARLLATGLGLDPSALIGRTQDPRLGPRAQDVSLDCARSRALGWRIPGPTEVFDQF